VSGGRNGALSLDEARQGRTVRQKSEGVDEAWSRVQARLTLIVVLDAVAARTSSQLSRR
jgi:hypothetical protein